MSLGVLEELYDGKKRIEGYAKEMKKGIKKKWIQKIVRDHEISLILYDISQNQDQKQLQISNQFRPKYKQPKKHNTSTKHNPFLNQIRLGHFKNEYYILYNLKDSYIDLIFKMLHQLYQTNNKIDLLQTQLKQNKRQYEKIIKKNQEEILRLSLKIQDFQLYKIQFDNDYDDLLYKFEEATKTIGLKNLEIQKLNHEIQRLNEIQRKKKVKIHFYSQEKGKQRVRQEQEQEGENKKEVEKDKDKNKNHKGLFKKKHTFKIIPLERQRQSEKQKQQKISKQKQRQKQQSRKNSLIDVQEDPILPKLTQALLPKKLNKFKIVEFVPTLHKSQSQPIRNKMKVPFTMMYQKGPTGEMTKLNALTLSLHDNLSTCETCQEIMIPYSIFDCNHLSCSNCLVRYIELELIQRQIPLCVSEECGQQCNPHTAMMFLTFKQRRDLCQKLQETIFRFKNKHKLYDCPKCHQTFQIQQKAKFVTHCNTIFCRTCGEQHVETEKCDEARYLTLLNQLIYPTVCPECYTLYDKDDKCDHVVCPNCKEKNPIGFCARCAVIRSPTMAHDISYHRVDCSFYAPNPEPLKREKKCLECNKLQANQHCDRPTETLKKFVQRVFGENFMVKFYEKRKQYQDLKDLADKI